MAMCVCLCLKMYTYVHISWSLVAHEYIITTSIREDSQGSSKMKMFSLHVYV